MSDDVKNLPEDCPRCGSLLPDPEEGVCLTCGYEYGRATLYMPVVRLDPKTKAPVREAELPELAQSSAPALAPRPPVADALPSRSGRLGLALGVVVVLFVLVVGLITAMILL